MRGAVLGLLLLFLPASGRAGEERTVDEILRDHALAIGSPGSIRSLRSTSRLTSAGGREDGVHSTWAFPARWERETPGPRGAAPRREIFGPDGAFIESTVLERYRPAQRTTRGAFYMYEGIANPFPLLPYIANPATRAGLKIAYAAGHEVLVGPYDSYGVRPLYLLDAKTHLLSQIQYEEEPGDPLASIAFHDWRPVGEALLPHGIGANVGLFVEDDANRRFERQDAGQYEQILSWEVNADVSRVAFRPPAPSQSTLEGFEVKVIATGPDPYEIDAADLDGDGKADVAVGCEGGLYVHFGGSEGTPVHVRVGKGHCRGVSIADFDLDGRPEVLCSSMVEPAEVLFRVDFDAKRAPRVRQIFGAPRFLWDLVVADLDLDGLPDLVSTGWGGSPRLDIKFNNACGGVRYAGSGWPLDAMREGRRGFGVAVGNIDADGRRDIAVADGARVVLFHGDDLLSFQPRMAIDQMPRPVDVAFADLDGDGRDDLLVVNYHPITELEEDLAVIRNTGTGFVGSQFLDVGRGAQAVVSADFDGDGNADAAVACSLSGEVVLLSGDGRCGFAPPKRIGMGRGASRLRARDLDGDGRVDLLCSNRLDDTVSIAMNRTGSAVRPSRGDAIAVAVPAREGVDFRLEGLSVPYVFQAEFPVPLDIPDPSGIALLGSDDNHAQLVLVSDKRPDLFRVTLDRRGRRMLVGPPIPLRGLGKERLDLEDVAYLGGNLFLPCEADNSVVRATLFGDVLARVKTPVGLSDNDGIEGAALRLCKDGTPLLYLFRERMGVTGAQPPAYCFDMEESPFALRLRGGPFPVPMFLLDQTAACCLGDRLFLVTRFSRGILELTFDGDRFRADPKHATFAKLTDDLLGLRSPTKPLFGMVEGIAVGESDLFLVLDNNGERIGKEGENAGREGRILWFRAEGEPRHRPMPVRVAAQQMLIAWSGSVGAAPQERTREEARALAQEIVGRLRAGESFAALAERYHAEGGKPTMQFSVAAEGRTPQPGDYRYGDLPAALARLVFALDVGEVGLCEFDSQESPEGWRVAVRIE